MAPTYIPICKSSIFEWVANPHAEHADAYLRIEHDDQRSIGRCMRDVLAAFLADAGPHDFLGRTFRPEDLTAVLSKDQTLMAKYQLRVRELVRDPSRAEGEWVSQLVQLVARNGDDLRPLLGVECLVDAGVDPTAEDVTYGLFSGIADPWSPLKVQFVFDLKLGTLSKNYALADVIQLDGNISVFVRENRLQLIRIQDAGNIGHDDTIISNDEIIINLREEIARRAREHFKQYVTDE